MLTPCRKNLFCMSGKISRETDEAWRNDPANWKWGVFYYNKKDPRLMPPKQNPALGVTVNFANKKSVFLFLILFSIPISITLIIIFINL